MAARGARVDLDAVVRQPRNRGLDDAEVFAINEAYNRNHSMLSEAYQRQAVARGTPHEGNWDAAIQAMEQHGDVLLQRFVPGASANGRNLVALRYAARGDLNPLQWQARARRALGEEYTSGVGREITRLIESGNRDALVEYVNSLVKPLRPREVEYWTRMVRAGFLTGGFVLRSAGRALAGNTGRSLYDRLSAPAALTWEHLLFHRLTKGKRGVGAPSFAQEQAAWRGTREGLRDIVARVRGKGVNLQGPDTFTRRPYANPIMDRLVNLPFDVLGAADAPFKRAARYRAIREQAEVMATEEGFRRRTPEFMTRAAQIEAHPPLEMVIRAHAAALEAGAQNPTILSRGARGFRKGLGQQSKIAQGISDLTATAFVQAPASVATLAIESTPLGAFSTAADAIRLYRMARAPDVDVAALGTLQRLAGQRAGRWTTGLLAGAITIDLYRRGIVTGAAPEGERERAQFFRDGRRQYSIRLGGRDYSLNQIQPLGGILAFFATLEQEREAATDPTEEQALLESLRQYIQATPAATRRTGQSIIQTPFFQGIKNVVDAFGPDENSNVTGRMVGGMIPGAVRDVARGLDPVSRVARGPMAGIKANLPGVSRGLPARIDPRSGVQEERRGWRWSHIFDVLGSSKVAQETDPVLAEAQRVGASLGRPTRKQGETDEAYEGRQAVLGKVVYEAWARVVELPLYRQASIEEQAELLRRVATDVRSDVTAGRRPRARPIQALRTARRALRRDSLAASRTINQGNQ